MASARLRKVFRYPDDNDSYTDNAPQEGIDEEEQDKLIAAIAAEDAKSISFYRTFFLAIPALALVYFMVLLLVMPYPAGANAAANPFFYTLCIVSLLLSLSMAYDIEPPPSSSSTTTLHAQAASAFPPPFAQLLQACLRWLNLINAGTCAVLALIALGSRASFAESITSQPITISVIPVVVVYLIVVIARHELRPVNVNELERMKYEYKGA